MTCSDNRRWRGSCIAGFIGCLFAILPAGAETVLANWDDFDACVAAEYENLTPAAPCYPPAEIGFTVSLPPLSFDTAAFADLTHAYPLGCSRVFPIGVKIRIAVGQVDKGKDYGKDKGCL